MIRRLRVFPLEELFVAQAIPGFVLAVGWSVMYEVYHEEGSYYISLLQEIVGTEGLFSSFLVSALLMAFPLGIVVDSVRHVVGELWLRLPERRSCGCPPDGPALLGGAPAGPADRYLAYRHLRAVTLTPAKAAGNLAVVFVILILWFVVKMYRIQGWHVYSWVFIVGAPLVGLFVVATLLIRYQGDMRRFQCALQPPTPPGSAAAASETKPEATETP
jgi:hypothetical protein